MKNKICNTCGLELNIDAFAKKGKSKFTGNQYYSAYCKKCYNKTRYLKYLIRVKKILAEQKRSFKCENCNYDKNYAALHFHHYTGEKNLDLSIRSGECTNDDDLSYEIYICKILCANCHIEEHNPNCRIEELKDI